jgi:hypothetical protein
MIPISSSSAPAALNSRCATRHSQSYSWEYKIGIIGANAAATPMDADDPILRTLGKNGWIFVSENQGIFHLKRPKR